jgi:hypothetical protein
MTAEIKRLASRMLRERMSAIGKSGGSVRGERKRRGGPEYYRALSAKAWAKRKAKREA